MASSNVVPFPKQPRTPVSEYVTVHDFARITSTHPATIYRAIKRGELPHIRIGRTLRIPRIAARIDTRPTWDRPHPDIIVTVGGEAPDER